MGEGHPYIFGTLRGGVLDSIRGSLVTHWYLTLNSRGMA